MTAAGSLLAALVLAGTAPAPASAPTPTATQTKTPAQAQPPAKTPPRSSLSEPAPRPAADLRIQNRLVHNASALHVFAGVDYLERRDFYVSPGVRAGASYYLTEALGAEVQASHYFSRLNDAARQVEQTYGALPDSRAPGWLFVGGLRAALGYGKIMMSGVSSAVHFQPQALLQVGLHVHEGNVGPSGITGVGLLVSITPRLFVRLDGALSLDVEARSQGTTWALGFLPSLVVGGAL